LKFLQKAVHSLREHYPWHGNMYHQQAHNWVENAYSKVSLRLGSLEDIMKVGSDVMKFNMNSRAEPYRELDKLFELRHQRVRLT
jgi:hypothetical protein